nr:MAG TPA: hypothetical protein [Caudoviricetes sp.]
MGMLQYQVSGGISNAVLHKAELKHGHIKDCVMSNDRAGPIKVMFNFPPNFREFRAVLNHARSNPVDLNVLLAENKRIGLNQMMLCVNNFQVFNTGKPDRAGT